MAKRSRGPRPPMGGGNMMKQLQQMQKQLAATQEALAEETVTATVGGGVIEVVATGDQRVESIKVDPEVLEDADVAMLQDLLLTAVNSALEQSQELAAEKLGPLAGGLPF